MAAATTFDDLNDYIVQDILKYLSVKDRTRYERVNKVLRRNLQQLWQRQYRLVIRGRDWIEFGHRDAKPSLMLATDRCYFRQHQVLDCDLVVVNSERDNDAMQTCRKLIAKCDNLIVLDICRINPLQIGMMANELCRLKRLEHLDLFNVSKEDEYRFYRLRLPETLRCINIGNSKNGNTKGQLITNKHFFSNVSFWNVWHYDLHQHQQDRGAIVGHSNQLAQHSLLNIDLSRSLLSINDENFIANLGKIEAISFNYPDCKQFVINKDLFYFNLSKLTNLKHLAIQGESIDKNDGHFRTFLCHCGARLTTLKFLTECRGEIDFSLMPNLTSIDSILSSQLGRLGQCTKLTEIRIRPHFKNERICRKGLLISYPREDPEFPRGLSELLVNHHNLRKIICESNNVLLLNVAINYASVNPMLRIMFSLKRSENLRNQLYLLQETKPINLSVHTI